MTRRMLLASAACLTAALVASCGGGPITPPVEKKPIEVVPPPNTPPTIDAIAVQGRRPRQPAKFADVGEIVDVTATVLDPETAVDELQYQWTATAGTFEGTGKAVTWKAPDAVDAPTKVTISLKVIENYGFPGQPKVFSQDVTSTVDIALHDSIKEVGQMAKDFLLDFSNTNLNDWQRVMRNFNAAACPQPADVDAEKNDVITNYTNYDMMAFNIGTPRVTVNFGGACEFRGRLGDACAVVRAFWDSVHIPTGVRSASTGDDIIAAAYSSKDSRWWLCASDYNAFGALAPTHVFYGR